MRLVAVALKSQDEVLWGRVRNAAIAAQADTANKATRKGRMPGPNVAARKALVVKQVDFHKDQLFDIKRMEFCNQEFEWDHTKYAGAVALDLRDSLAHVAREFGALEFPFIVEQLKRPSVQAPRIAAALAIQCGAFGTSRTADEEAEAKAYRLALSRAPKP